MTIKPTKDRLLLRPLASRPVSDGGIHLLEKFNDDKMQWIVEAIGPDVTEVAIGDRVLTPLHFDHETLSDGRKLVRKGQLLMAWMKNPTIVGPTTRSEEASL